MANTKPLNLEDYIEPLYMNGLQGRMLRVPAPKGRSREILFIYGHHASLERMFGFVEFLSRYGAVTMPDLPGLGGMESFYKLGMKPSIDNLADYLAAFIKLRYKRRRVTIFGLSVGFSVVTRMLQKYPELVERVDLLVSVVGFVHKDDFNFKRRDYYLLRYGATVFSNRLPAWLLRQFLLRPFIIRATYRHFADKHVKLKDADSAERDRRINFEILLWQKNDIRTHMDIGITMLTLDLCKQQVNLPVHHIYVDSDHFLDNHIVEQHMRIIYSDFDGAKSNMNGHSQTVIATAKDVAPFFPRKIRSLLKSS